MTPLASLLGIVLFLGAMIFVAGIIYTINAIASRKYNDQWGWYLVEGIVDVVFGLILMANPAITLIVLPFLLGFWTLFGGIIQIGGAFSLRSMGLKSWWVVFVGGMLTALLGFAIIMHPLISSVLISGLIGLTFILFGLLYIVVSFGLKKLLGNA